MPQPLQDIVARTAGAPEPWLLLKLSFDGEFLLRRQQGAYLHFCLRSFIRMLYSLYSPSWERRTAGFSACMHERERRCAEDNVAETQEKRIHLPLRHPRRSQTTRGLHKANERRFMRKIPYAPGFLTEREHQAISFLEVFATAVASRSPLYCSHPKRNPCGCRV